MKNVTFTGIMASILMTTGATFAATADASLTTKGYVDAGLKAVYTTAHAADVTASANASSIASLQSAVNQNASAIEGLQSSVSNNASAIEDLQSSVSENASAITSLQSTVNAIDTTPYTFENGVKVDSATNTVGLDVTAEEGKMYVFKGGADSSASWEELEVTSVWNSSVLSD